MLHSRLVLLLSTALSATAAAQTWTPASAPNLGDPNNALTGSVELDGFLYTAAINVVSGAEVWRYDGVGPQALSSGGGFGDPSNLGIGAAIEFDGSIFVAAGNLASPVEVWRFDGANWTQSNVDGFGNPARVNAAFEVLDGVLYATSVRVNGGCGVHRYDPVTGWTTLEANGFGSLNNRQALLDVFNGNLYAGTFNDLTGGEVWRHDGGTSWTRVDPGSGMDASGPENQTTAPYSFNGTLYVATENFSTGSELWEYQGGTTWTQFGMDGFGNSANFDVDPATIFEGDVVFATLSFTGAEVWRFAGGTNLVPINLPGFGDSANEAVVNFVEFDGALHAATFNAIRGGQVWRYEGGTTWTKLDPGVGGFGSTSNDVAQLSVLRGELHATVADRVWRLTPEALGTPFCSPGTPNSAGSPGVLGASGRAVAAANDFTLNASSLPTNSFGFFLVSRTFGSGIVPPGSVGRLCLTGSIGRFVGTGQIQTSGAAGAFSLQTNLTQQPTPNGLVAVQAGETWCYQTWHRDSAGGTPVSNFTEGLTVTFR
ncbi:MAG: hypothetical protein AAF726_05340 [Planctomycetota bacterium]